MKNNHYFIFVFAVILLSYVSVSVFADAPVPASETVVIKGELNDSFENASFFDHETAYTFGKTPQAGLAQTPLIQKPLHWFSKALFSPASLLSDPKISFSVARLVENPKVFWRKTKIEQPGAMLVSLEYEPGSNYDLQVFNSCMENICNPTTIESSHETTLFEENCNAGNLNARWTGGITTFNDTANVFKHNNGGWSDVYNNTAYDSMALNVSFTAKTFGGGGGNSNLRFKFMSNQQDRDAGGLGYTIDVWGQQYIRLNKHTETQEINLINSGVVPQSGTTYEIRVTRNAQGVFELFVNGTSRGTATDTSYTRNSFIVIASDSHGAEIDSIKITHPGESTGGAKTCAINVTNDYYYFKVTHLNGAGKYTLDADFVEGTTQASAPRTCSKPFITIVSPAIDPQITKGETQDFEITAKDLDGENIQYSWFVNDSQLPTDKNYATINSSDLPIGTHTVKARVSDAKFSDEYYWNLTILEPLPQEIPGQEIVLTAKGEQSMVIPENTTVEYFLLRNNKWEKKGSFNAKKGDVIKIIQPLSIKMIFKNNQFVFSNGSRAFNGIKASHPPIPLATPAQEPPPIQPPTQPRQELDQQNNAPISTHANGGFGATMKVAQSFAPTKTASIALAQFPISYLSGASNNITLEVYSDNSGNPSTLVNSSCSSTINGFSSPAHTNYNWFDFSFSAGCNLAAGTKYWLVLSSPNSSSTSTYVAYIDARNNYANGMGKYYNNAWREWNTNYDLIFKEYLWR